MYTQLKLPVGEMASYEKKKLKINVIQSAIKAILYYCYTNCDHLYQSRANTLGALTNFTI